MKIALRADHVGFEPEECFALELASAFLGAQFTRKPRPQRRLDNARSREQLYARRPSA